MPEHATLFDFRDLDLMLRLDEEADAEGWADTAMMAEALGFGEDARPLGSRFSWMKRYGMLEFDERRKMWRLSEGGRRVTQARVRAATSNGIERLPDEAMIDVMAKVTQRFIYGEPMVAQMLRREFLFGTKRR